MTKTAEKPYPGGCTYQDIAYIREYPPPPLGITYEYSVFLSLPVPLNRILVFLPTA